MQALLPTPIAIVNTRTSDSAGARANVLNEVRIARRPLEKITQAGEQLQCHAECSFSSDCGLSELISVRFRSLVLICGQILCRRRAEKRTVRASRVCR